MIIIGLVKATARKKKKTLEGKMKSEREPAGESRTTQGQQTGPDLSHSRRTGHSLHQKCVGVTWRGKSGRFVGWWGTCELITWEGWKRETGKRIRRE